MSRTYILNICIVAQLAYFVAIPLWGAISDRIGRRIPMMIGAAGIGAWGFAFFPLLESGSTLLVALAPAVGLFIVGAMYGPQAAFFAELFGTRVRYTGASLSYQLAGAIAGGFTPIVAVALLDRYDSTLAISIFMLAVATVSFLVIAVLSETYRRHLEERSEEEREGERRMVEDVELARVLG